MNTNVIIIAGVVGVALIGLFFLAGSDMEPAVDPMDVEPGTEVTMDDTTPPAEPPPVTNPTIADLAMDTPELSTLLDAVIAADLGVVLDTEGPFTVFAPTNTAFAAVPEETLTALLQPENIDDLQALLGLHVVPGEALAGDLSDGMTVTTLTGDELTVSVDADGTVTVGGATVVTADVQAANGVVHIIDTVITEPS